MGLNYKLTVWSPAGVPLRTILRDEMTMRSTGFWARLSPEGDGIEANFTARGSARNALGILDAPNWGIPCLSAVQISYDLNGTWVPIYYGQVRQGGNSMDVYGESYVLRSLALRLDYVTLSPGFSTPKQAAHLTVRAILQDVIGSGQLAGLILYDETKCPDLGFDCRAITDANQQTAGAFLRQIVQDGQASTPPVDVRYGVGPDRVAYMQLARTDTATLTDSDVRAQVWKPPVAETPCTVVRWFVAQMPATGAQPVRWYTHDSVSPDAATYGTWVRRESVPSGLSPWVNVPGIYELYERSGSTWALSSPHPSLPAETLTDGELNTPYTEIFSIAGDAVYLTLKPVTRPDRYVIAGQITGDGGTIIAPHNQPDASGPQPPGYEARITGGWNIHTIYVTPEHTRGLATLSHLTASNNLGVNIAEFRAEALNRALLDGLAKSYYSVPAPEPSALTLNAFRAPADLSGRVSYGAYTRAVTAWEYRVSSAGGLELTAQAGQPDDPGKVAQASLIKARDQQATLNALTAQR